MDQTTLLPRAADLFDSLRREFKHNLTGYLHGKSVMRDYLVSQFRLSELAAEQLIDEWEEQAWLRFAGDPTKASHRGALWEFSPSIQAVRS